MLSRGAVSPSLVAITAWASAFPFLVRAVCSGFSDINRLFSLQYKILQYLLLKALCFDIDQMLLIHGICNKRKNNLSKYSRRRAEAPGNMHWRVDARRIDQVIAGEMGEKSFIVVAVDGRRCRNSV
jgi:hypothetical protein